MVRFEKGLFSVVNSQWLTTTTTTSNTTTYVAKEAVFCFREQILFFA